MPRIFKYNRAMVEVSQSVYVSAAHRYWNSQWSHEKNVQIYGASASPEGVGSNLRLEFSGPESELLRLKQLIDHRCLFTDIPEFADRPSTLEKITEYLAARVPAGAGLRVYENDHLSCTCRGGEITVSLKVMNLTVTVRAPIDAESGLAMDRALVTQEVKKAFAESAEGDPYPWSQQLFSRLKSQIENLHSLRIDLNRHEYILINS